MISLNDLMQVWGFTSHPFASYTAENEPRLPEYFVAPPYLDDMIGSASSMTPAIVFGSRGIGKSAIRIYIETICTTEDAAKRVGGKALAISYDDFSKATEAGIDKVSAERHLEAILNKAVTAALAVIASSVNTDVKVTQDAIKGVFPNLDISMFSRLVQKYFIPMTELQKENSFRGTYSYFHKHSLSVIDRVNWFQKLWANLRIPLIDVANLIQSARGKDTISPTPSQLPSSTPPVEGAALEVLINDLHTISAITEQLGYDGWYILIDKVDEDGHTDSDAIKSAKLILPLLKNLRILEIARVGFKFFLWNQLRPILVEEKVRLDKIRNWQMQWTEQELREMINRRLAAYSDNRVNDILAICDDDAADIYELVIYYSMSSPREIAHILDSIFRQHARHSDESDGILITKTSIDLGIDDYCMTRIADIYPSDIVRTITRLPKTCFTSGDVQSFLRISRQAASVRINKWSDDGYIERTEDTRSDKDSSKSVYQYVFKEKRFERIVQRRLNNDPTIVELDDEQDDGFDWSDFDSDEIILTEPEED